VKLFNKSTNQIYTKYTCTRKQHTPCISATPATVERMHKMKFVLFEMYTFILFFFTN